MSLIKAYCSANFRVCAHSTQTRKFVQRGPKDGTSSIEAPGRKRKVDTYFQYRNCNTTWDVKSRKIQRMDWSCTQNRAGEVPALSEDSRQRPTFPRGRPRSIISAEGLNYRVRDGYGWVPFAIATGKSFYMTQ